MHIPSGQQVAIKQIDLEDSDDDITEIQQASFKLLAHYYQADSGSLGDRTSIAMRLSVHYALLLVFRGSAQALDRYDLGDTRVSTS